MRHTNRCGPGATMQWRYIDAVADGHPVRACMEWLACSTCGTWLPLGQSDEAPVAVEVRAAELAGMTGPERYAPRFENRRAIKRDEMRGWDAAMMLADYQHRDRRQYVAGHLARVIFDHNAEQAKERSGAL